MNELIELTVTNGIPTTTSMAVAAHFGKRHDNVLRDIEKMECSKEFNLLNFEAIARKDDRNRLQPGYALTKDGFVFLAMGFTGKEAATWKERYIAAFNAMEAELLKRIKADELPKQDGQQFLSHRAAPLSAACFWGDWHSGLIGLPYQSCLSEQVYRAYTHWCKLTSEPYPLQHGQFTQALVSHCQNKGIPAEMRVVRLDATLTKALPSMGRMLLVSQPPSEALGAWATELVLQFEKHLTQYFGKEKN